MLSVPIKARPPTSATRQQQKIRMIKQCCAVYNRHIPAVENTWRPRKTDESYEEYRLRVVERGDGDLFRAWQIMETALKERTMTLYKAVVDPHLENHQRLQLKADPEFIVVVRDSGGGQWRAGHCNLCRMLVVVRGCAEGDRHQGALRCDICSTIEVENDRWAPHMQCKEISKKRKKKKKKKKKRAPQDTAAISSEDLAQLSTMVARPAGKRPRRSCEQLSLGMDTQPEQTLRPTLQSSYI